jgi:hypothetical protein
MPFPLLLVVCIGGVVMFIIIIDTFRSSVRNIIQQYQIRTNPPLNSIEII